MRHALSLLLLASSLAAAPLRVDLNTDVDRKDVQTRGWTNWRVPQDSSASLSEGAVKFTLSVQSSSPAKLSTAWWKRGYDTGATLASDGVFAPAGTSLALRLEGLKSGRHSLTTYHSLLNGKASALSVAIEGQPATQRTLTPSFQVADDRDAAFAHLDFEVPASGTVTLLVAPAAPSPEAQVVLNGFVLDQTNPALLASRPSPANGDEHAPEDSVLSWRAADGISIHTLYLGESAEAVAAATPASPEFKGHLAVTRHEAGRLDPHKTYYWRVDEVDANRRVTRGELWSFRPRQLAFPGAEGYGRFAIGGRGGRVLEVTHLGDSGPGSLRAAVEAEGPRTVVFRVGGAIRLKSKLIITKPYITVAGQTAPGDGIAVHGYTFGAYGTHDVIIRHVRIRVGDESGATLDGSGLGGCDHAIMDHCSIAWSIDEGFSSRGARNITLQRTIIAEPLNLSVHSHYVGTGKGHAYAGSVSGDIASLHHNLLVNCAGRNWSLAGGLTGGGRFAGRMDIRNNVVYNWKDRTNDGGVKALNLVANYYIPGPATTVFHLLMPDLGSKSDPQTYYLEGNVMEGRREYDADNWAKGGVRLQPKELEKTKMTLEDVDRLVRLRAPFC